MKDNDSKLIAESWLTQSGFSFPTFSEGGHEGHEKDHPGKTCKEDHPNDPSVKGHEDKYEAKTEDKELEEEKEDTIEEAMPSVGAQQLEGYGAQIIQALGAWAANNAEQNTSLPAYMLINGPSSHPGAGYLPKKFSPLPIVDPGGSSSAVR